MPLDYYHKLDLAISDVIKEIREKDAGVSSVEIRGATLRYRIWLDGSAPLPPNDWKVTRLARADRSKY